MRVFLGCEGASEQGYGALLSRLARDRRDIHIHIDAVDLQPGGGDPLALVIRAVQQITKRERGRVPYAVKALLLDRDTIGQTPARDAEAMARAGSNDLLLIWQDPVHEAFLLRHLEGCGTWRPPKSDCMATLQGKWPDYRKPMTANRLAERIQVADIQRASLVEAEFAVFLRAIGWLP